MEDERLESITNDLKPMRDGGERDDNTRGRDPMRRWGGREGASRRRMIGRSVEVEEWREEGAPSEESVIVDG